MLLHLQRRQRPHLVSTSLSSTATALPANLSNTSIAPTTISKTAQQSGSCSSPASTLVNQTQPKTSTAKTLPTTSSATTLPARSAPGATSSSTTTFQSVTAPPGLTTMQPLPLASSGRTNTNINTNTNTNPANSSTHPNQQPTAYTSPSNPGYNLTPSDLQALRSGRPDARGDTVYFKPGFIDDNPWKALQETARAERGLRNES